jgi:hypothetical protein
LGGRLKHWTVYEKFFYRASWCLMELSLLVLTRLMTPLLGAVIEVVVDDTTCGPRGRHVALAGWYKDASAHARAPVIHWAHNWVILAVVVRLARWPGLRLTLPVFFALHRKKDQCDARHRYKTLPQLARELVCRVAEALPGRQIASRWTASTPPRTSSVICHPMSSALAACGRMRR